MSRFLPIPTELVTGWRRRQQPDAYGLPPERAVSAGTGVPCRHCLKQVPQGRIHLILAHRPFLGLNPYTETGPIFLCADDCPAAEGGFPQQILTAPAHTLRGYGRDERIIYGTGAVVETARIEARCRELFGRPELAFIHIRSASNNCFLCRAERD